MRIEIFDLYTGERYQLWRKRNKVRLTDVAQYCGSNTSALSQWENGILKLPQGVIDKYNDFITKFELSKK